MGGGHHCHLPTDHVVIYTDLTAVVIMTLNGENLHIWEFHAFASFKVKRQLPVFTLKIFVQFKTK